MLGLLFCYWLVGCYIYILFFVILFCFVLENQYIHIRTFHITDCFSKLSSPCSSNKPSLYFELNISQCILAFAKNFTRLTLLLIFVMSYFETCPLLVSSRCQFITDILPSPDSNKQQTKTEPLITGKAGSLSTNRKMSFYVLSFYRGEFQI